MTEVIRRDVPADIVLFKGRFASQPLAFAHLLDAAPDLDLGHVEVVTEQQASTRLTSWFSEQKAAALAKQLEEGESMIVVLPQAYDGQTCPLGETEHLIPLGIARGIVVHLSVAPS